jgi:hypothetical protein
MEECPVCLEPLTGTVVQMGCCHNKVHIQCYLPKCPLCRSILPLPRNTEPNQIIVPVPVPVPREPTRFQKCLVVVPALGSIFAVGLVMVIVNTPRG